AGDHEHTPGAGRAITAADVSLFDESRQRASAVKGRYVPVGTECVTEPFLGCLDMYYPRNAGLSMDMETFPYVRTLTWLPDGQMEIVPLWPFVYHEYGPVAMQGIHPISPWKASQGEDFCTWAEARAFFWGGLMTAMPVPQGAELSTQRVRYLRSLVAARTQFARDFLVYGRMQQPPELLCSTTRIDHGLAEGGWVRKIRIPGTKPDLKAILGLPDGSPEGSTEGSTDENKDSKELSVESWVEGMLALPAAVAKNRALVVPAVMCEAYTFDDRLGLLLVNLRPDADESIELTVDPVGCGLPEGTYRLRQLSVAKEESLGTFENRRQVKLAVTPREVILLEASIIQARSASE
ncbi:hypothetical protein LCGC14_2882380, partial [marine sediment metagenome]